MRKRIVGYRKQIDALLLNAEHKEGDHWEGVRREHLTQIAFFQHERLIHLIVTGMFAVLAMISAGCVFVTREMFFGILTLLFLVLLIPYIAHYYILENEVQRMYRQYDEIQMRCTNKER